MRYLSVKAHLIPNPRHQFVFHAGMSGFWLMTIFIAPFIHTFQGINNLPALLIMEVSLYSNFATEFGAIAAAQTNIV